MNDDFSSVFIGTSGWSYNWKNFYPKSVSSRKRLDYYSSQFPTAEVNYSFYRLPKENTYEKWEAQTPDHFQFALKLSRYVTHIKRLKGIKQSLRDFLKRATCLGKKLGPILVQLPPSFKLDLNRMNYFLETAESAKEEMEMKNLRLAFEPRHVTWFQDTNDRNQMIDLLKKHNSALVFAHSNKYPYPNDEPITTDFVYLRFHGPEKLFGSPYHQEKLHPFAEKIKNWRNQNMTVYAYFNNDMNGYAPDDAKTLYNLLRET